MPLAEVNRDSPTELGAAARLLTAADRETYGATEPARRPEALADWLDPPSGRRRLAILATEGGEAAGVGTMQLRSGAGNDHLAWVRELFVAHDRRRRGHGHALLERLSSVARADRRSFLALRHLENDDAGRRFADRSGARMAMTVEQQRVATAAIAPELLRSWVERAAERAQGYDLVAWDDVCPPDLLEAFAAAQGVMNDAPRPESTNDWLVTPADIRSIEAMHAHMGTTQWVAVARDRASGELAGYTEITFERHTPWLAHQGDTGVAAQHRERGLGRWLKAVNLLRLLAERPSVTSAETANAGGNAPMLAINNAIGFRQVATWQDRELWLD